jgi:2-oxoglutarate dehydrogenase complex dehydrogenase (E1) component-like enzyme
MPSQSDPESGLTSWFEKDLYRGYPLDRSAVDESWKTVFDQTGGPAASLLPPALDGRKLSKPFSMIGIGAAVTRRPLPHHRAYGSVHGGSRRLR